MFDTIVIHHSEIAIKGKNRANFERRLVENIRKKLDQESYESISREDTKILIKLNKKSNKDKIEGILGRIFGIAWFSFAHSSNNSIDDLKKIVVEKTQDSKDKTIKVISKRSNKAFPLNSMELNKEIGTELVKQGFKVSMKPELPIYIEIGQKESHIFFEKIQGMRGLPVGVTGKGLCLLSGGIDSPVSALLMMKRGCEIDFLHFYAQRDSKEVLNSKIEELVKLLNEYQIKSNLILVPFTIFQISSQETPSKYDLIIFKRFIFKLAEKQNYKFLVTGDSLAQVASQTLENITVIEQGIKVPIFKPLIGMDKEDIIKLSKKFGLYELSIKEYKDCCSIIAAHPITKAKQELVEKYEKELDIDKILKETLEKVETFKL